MITKEDLENKLKEIKKNLAEHSKDLSDDRKTLSSLINHIKLASDICIAEAYVKGFDDGQKILIEAILKDMEKDEEEEFKSNKEDLAIFAAEFGVGLRDD